MNDSCNTTGSLPEFSGISSTIEDIETTISMADECKINQSELIDLQKKINSGISSIENTLEGMNVTIVSLDKSVMEVNDALKSINEQLLQLVLTI